MYKAHAHIWRIREIDDVILKYVCCGKAQIAKAIAMYTAAATETATLKSNEKLVFDFFKLR